MTAYELQLLVPSPRLFDSFRYFFAIVAVNDSEPLTIFSASTAIEVCPFKRLGHGCHVRTLHSIFLFSPLVTLALDVCVSHGAFITSADIYTVIR